ncbi:MAG: caspase family protein [Bacteroidota bacterium]
MSEMRQVNFTTQLKRFKERISKLKAANKNRLVLIIMSNTHDPALSTGCAKDAAAVKNTFKTICSDTDYNFCCIEISGKNYSRENLRKAIEIMGLYNDVTVFYYSGHGFSYAKDSKSKYPQIDMRSHNNKANFNKIGFIEKHTENLAVLLNIMRFNGGRINIAIADCCNTTIPFYRKKSSIKDMNIVDGIMPRVSKGLTKKLYTDFHNSISILVSSSVQGQPAISDDATGSIFTRSFTETIKTLLAKELKTKEYLPWLKVLKATSVKAFKDSKSYDIGNGIAGKQKAVFEVFIDNE